MASFHVYVLINEVQAHLKSLEKLVYYSLMKSFWGDRDEKDTCNS